MRCDECDMPFSVFDRLIPLFQAQISGEGAEPTGYAHAWHFKPVEDRN